MWPYLRFSSITLPTYYLLISAGCSVGLVWAARRSQERELPAAILSQVSLLILFFGFIGARVFHILYEEPLRYQLDPLSALYFWQGGFVYLGGFLLAFLGAFMFLKWVGEPFLKWADMAGPPVSLAYIFGRMGCYLSGCCYGKVCELVWAVRFPGDVFFRHPTQLYAAVGEALVLFLTLTFEKTRIDTNDTGKVFSVWLTLHCLNRIGMEYFRADPRGPTIFSLSISTFLCLAILGAIVVLNGARKLIRA